MRDAHDITAAAIVDRWGDGGCDLVEMIAAACREAETAGRLAERAAIYARRGLYSSARVSVPADEYESQPSNPPEAA